MKSSVVISKQGSLRLKRGQIWIFRSDIEQAQAEAGDIVAIRDRGNNTLGYGFYSASQLALRVLTRGAQVPDRAFFQARLSRAIAYRATLYGQTRDALRLVHGEADGLPGLLVDRYGDALTIQSLTAGFDKLESWVIDSLKSLVAPKTIVIRNDGMTREYENLPDLKALVHGEESIARYHEGALQFEIDLLSDQKTGSFLDQYDNHLLAPTYSHGQALDMFSYHGGFGLQMARRAAHVTCVDQSEQAVARITANAARNQITNATAVCANAFDYLKACDESEQRFDTIVIDPPSFAKRKSALDGALRGYKELNLRALKLLNPGGFLISCSCSAKLTPSLFESLLAEAASDAKRQVIVVQRRGAGFDHPALLGMPETEYLKCFVLYVRD